MSHGTAPDQRLLRALAEQLKLPLLQIARQAELAANPDNIYLNSINSIAEMSLRLIDGFLLSAENYGQEALPLEPVSVSSLLYDTAQMLQPLAKQHDCEIEVHLSGRYGPAMAHAESLQAAFTLLGYSLVEARTADKERHQLILAAHRSVSGLVAGLFDNQPGLTTDMLRRGRALYGHARQAMPTVGAGAGAGIFVADSLLRNMEAPLHMARHHKLNGLATTLIPSQQLQMV
jgi:hypothetical protein